MVREEHWHFHLRLIISDERYRYRCSVLLSFSRIAGYTSEPEWNVGDAQCYAVCSKEKSTIPHLIVPEISFLLGIGIGAEYPCGSVSASEQSEQPGINKRAQHRWVALATSEKIPFLALRYWYFLSSRYYDRLWIRGSSICATGALLDVHWDLPECSMLVNRGG